jgi:hypothetical protein
MVCVYLVNIITIFVAYSDMRLTLNFKIIRLALKTFDPETPGSTAAGCSNYINLKTFSLKKNVITNILQQRNLTCP